MSAIRWLILFCLFPILAQTQEFDPWLESEKLTKTRKIKKAAKQADNFGYNYLALELYEKLYNANPEKEKYLQKAAQLALKVKNYDKALKYHEILVSLDSSNFNLLQLVSLQIQTGDTINPMIYLNELTETKTNGNFDRNHKKWSENLQQGQVWRTKRDSLIQFPYEFKELKNINSYFSEQLPKLFNKKLYYLTFKENTPVLLKPTQSLLDFQTIQIAEKKLLGWEVSDSLSIDIPDPQKQFLGGICPVTDSLFLLSVCAPNYRGKTVCQLYWGNYQEAKSLALNKLPEPINVLEYTSTQPYAYLFEDNIRVYFTSNRPEGKGGLDIWFFEFKPDRESYSGVRNAGSKINSAFDEAYPFYSSNKLYFSSNYHAGYGGFDVFKAYGEKTKFEEPKNIHEVNSSYDDIGYSLLEDSTAGIMLSNRPNNNQKFGEGCCDDIYFFNIENPNEINYPIQVIEMVDGKKKVLTDVISIVGIKENTQYTTILTDTLTNGFFYEKLDTTNTWLFRFGKKGYFYKGVEWNNAVFDTVNKENPLIVEVEKIPQGEILLKDIYYEFDSPDLTEKAKTTISNTIYKLLIWNPQLSVQINSHTDSKGKLSYNYKLSKARAKSVVDYLVELGIDKSRLKAKGYGETKPVANNFNADGTDNPEGRALNRRTTFTVLE